MNQQIKAIYGNGVLKPLDPVYLREHEVVTLSINKVEANGQDAYEDYSPIIAEDGDPSITWEQVRTVLAKLPGSLVADLDRERDERF